ncbi:MAG: type II secretion system protein [Nitrospirota bacterium]
MLEGFISNKRDELTKLRPEKSDGFTLLELTISITMIGFIVLIISGALRLSSRSVISSEKKVESLERIRSSIHVIDSQIQSQIPLSYVEEGEKKYYFRGGPDFMELATNYSVWGGKKGYSFVSYKIEAGEDGRQVLYVSETTVGLEGRRDAKLFDTFDRIYFEYFYEDPVEEVGQWTEQWSLNGIPEKVKLHLIEGTKDLALIIPVRVGGMLPLFGGTESFEEVE